jgi:hypothetical protein
LQIPQIVLSTGRVPAQRHEEVAMNAALGEDGSGSRVIPAADLRFLRIMLGLQVRLGLLWGVSMLFFARQIVLGAAEGPHIEKIAMEGAAHMALVFGADLVYIPLLGLSEIDFYAKVIVNAVLAIGLALAGRRAGLLKRSLSGQVAVPAPGGAGDPMDCTSVLGQTLRCLGRRPSAP